MKRKSFFTIVELLVVMAIIGIIMAVLLPALSKARAVGKRTACLSNLRQIGTAMQLYKIDNNLSPVPFTSLLFPEYISSTKAYQCPADLNPSTRPANEWLEKMDNDWNEIYDRPSPDGIKSIGVYGAIHKVAAGNVSYFYEMSETNCLFSFKSSSGTTIDTDADRTAAGFPIKSKTTWAIWKEWQLNYGNDTDPAHLTSYSVSAFPIYRCFWHIKNASKYSESNRILDPDAPVINVTYAGNYVLTKAKWELGIWNP
jgi:type II secretory pathway pseudopilin PulG